MNSEKDYRKSLTLGDRMVAELSPLEKLNQTRALELVQLREHFQCTQQRLARFLDVSSVTVGKWERGEARVPLAVIKLLSLLRSNSINATKMAEEIIKLKNAAGFGLSETEGEQSILDSKPWEQQDFINEILETEAEQLEGDY